MKKKTLGIVLAAILSLGAVATVAAQAAEGHGHGRHGRDGRGGMGGGMFMGKEAMARLNLTDDQKAKLKQMHERQREQMKAQFQQGRQDNGLMQEVFKDNPNPAVIQQRVAEMQQRQAAALTAHVAAMQEFNSILTSEQRAEMQKLMAERAQ